MRPKVFVFIFVVLAFALWRRKSANPDFEKVLHDPSRAVPVKDNLIQFPPTPTAVLSPVEGTGALLPTGTALPVRMDGEAYVPPTFTPAPSFSTPVSPRVVPTAATPADYEKQGWLNR